MDRKTNLMLISLIGVVFVSLCTQIPQVPSISGAQNPPSNTTIPQTCSDGTAYGSCSSILPKYCDNGNLISKCSQCGCPETLTCQSDGTCTGMVIGGQ